MNTVLSQNYLDAFFFVFFKCFKAIRKFSVEKILSFSKGRNINRLNELVCSLNQQDF